MLLLTVLIADTRAVYTHEQSVKGLGKTPCWVLVFDIFYNQKDFFKKSMTFIQCLWFTINCKPNNGWLDAIEPVAKNIRLMW